MPFNFNKYETLNLSRLRACKSEGAEFKIKKKYEDLLYQLGYQINNNNNGYNKCKKRPLSRK